MKNLKGCEIRDLWIKFFESKGHKYMPGVNLIPQGDKSLLWVNAGVTGLKKYFDGSEIPPCRRIVNVQKSIRTNDIENVGHTARHHTFFEMLGNFSIGDYFRKEVIEWAFEILTSKEWFDFPVEKIYVTYNPTDLETFEYWQKNGLPKDHLIPLEGNYWQIGEGPCGPNTEVFFDRGEEYDPEHRGISMLQNDEENDRYIEIWGIVFSQFNAVNGVERKDYKELPSKNIDTGSGLERIACICQQTPTNFETDLFMPIIEATKLIANKPYEGEYLLPYRVIADHIRCLTFSLSDGAYFSNEGRGYVLRRIIRRAIRYGRKLGINDSFMYRLVDCVVDNYSSFYPNLIEKKEFVKKVIKAEENKFSKTLEGGEALLKAFIKEHNELDGPTAFKLYDTFGFPVDMSKEICEENGVSIDLDGFNACMEAQKENSRAARGEIQSFNKQSKDLLQFKEKSTFSYEKIEIESKVIGLFKDGVKVDEIDEEGEVCFAETPFFAESGGQVSDKGSVSSDSAFGEVSKVFKAPNGSHLLHVNMSYGSIKLGDVLVQKVDANRRALITRNHSATHLMHAAIGNVLKEHVDQKGSYVDENYLRFDFSSLNKLSKEQLKAIEDEVNQKILESIDELTEVLPIEQAKKIGAEMEFEGKYGDIVRVVEFGDYSKEFCGGTHVKNTSEIGLFVIESEGSIASGVRRIQARTSIGALNFLKNRVAVLDEVESKLLVNDTLINSKINKLNDKISELTVSLESEKQKLLLSQIEPLLKEVVNVNGVNFLAKRFPEADRNEVLARGDLIKQKLDDYVILLLGKDSLTCFAKGKGALTGAGKVIKTIAPLLEGNGGGKNEIASGSAKNFSKLDEAIKLAKTLL